MGCQAVKSNDVMAGHRHRGDGQRAAGGRVDGLAIPAEVNVGAEYPIVILSGSDQPEEAGAFLDYVLSDEGAATMRSFGFSAP